MCCFRNQQLCLYDVLYFIVTFNLRQTSHIMLKCVSFHPWYSDIWYSDIFILVSLQSCECSFKDAENRDARLISLKCPISNILESHQLQFFKNLHVVE